MRVTRPEVRHESRSSFVVRQVVYSPHLGEGQHGVLRCKVVMSSARHLRDRCLWANANQGKIPVHSQYVSETYKEVGGKTIYIRVQRVVSSGANISSPPRSNWYSPHPIDSGTYWTDVNPIIYGVHYRCHQLYNASVVQTAN